MSLDQALYNPRPQYGKCIKYNDENQPYILMLYKYPIISHKNSLEGKGKQMFTWEDKQGEVVNEFRRGLCMELKCSV